MIKSKVEIVKRFGMEKMRKNYGDENL